MARGSGGWSSPKENEVAAGALKAQLYDMQADPGETENLYDSKPEVAAKLLALLRQDVNNGRSTEGGSSKNDVSNVVLWKSEASRGKSLKNSKADE